MAEPHIEKCNLCRTRLCTLIILFKLIFGCVFLNRYSNRWEMTLPRRKRTAQRKKKKKIRTYQWITSLMALVNFMLTLYFYGLYSEQTILSLISSTAYLSAFWFVIQGREEFRLISQAWHTGKRRELYSKIWMTEHVKVIVIAISLAEFAACCSIKFEAAWIVVTLLQSASCFLLLHPSISRLFPRDRNRDNVLVYRIERIVL